MMMEIGTWMIIILLFLLAPSVIALILCLILIQKKSYKKLIKKQIYAGFWFRLLAGLVDWIILAIISIVLAFIPVIGWILGIFVYWLYYAIQHSSSKKATIGMRACDIIIVDENYNKIGFWRATGNYFVSSLSWFFFIGFFMIAFTSKKQGFHNFISRTLCIKPK